VFVEVTVLGREESLLEMPGDLVEGYRLALLRVELLENFLVRIVDPGDETLFDPFQFRRCREVARQGIQREGGKDAGHQAEDRYLDQEPPAPLAREPVLQVVIMDEGPDGRGRALHQPCQPGHELADTGPVGHAQFLFGGCDSVRRVTGAQI